MAPLLEWGSMFPPPPVPAAPFPYDRTQRPRFPPSRCGVRARHTPGNPGSGPLRTPGRTPDTTAGLRAIQEETALSREVSMRALDPPPCGLRSRIFHCRVRSTPPGPFRRSRMNLPPENRRWACTASKPFPETARLYCARPVPHRAQKKKIVNTSSPHTSRITFALDQLFPEGPFAGALFTKGFLLLDTRRMPQITRPRLST